MKKNAFITFCSACVPGCGQMYLGYMKRGVSLMFWFMAVIAVSVLLRLEILMMFLFVIWAYAFFDTFNLRNLSPEQRAAFADGYIPNAKWVDEAGIKKLVSGAKFGALAGWALIVIGAVVMFQNLWYQFSSYVWNELYPLGPVIDMIPRLIVGLLIVLLGVRMLRGGKKPDDDITEFKGEDTDGEAK